MSGETRYASAARTRDLFERARAQVAIEDLVARMGLKVTRAGREYRSACPICGSGAKSRNAFSIKDDRWRCYGACDDHGDVVDLEQKLGGGTPMEAVTRLLGGDMPAREARPAPAKADGPSSADRLALELWAAGKPFAGSLGERYLRSRGIAAEVIARAAPNLRFLHRAKHSWDSDAGAWNTAPAMLAQVVVWTADGPAPTGGVHVTYLAPDGTGKSATLSPVKRMWGPQNAPDGRPGGAWLIGPAGNGDLVVAEGIETALSVASLASMKGLEMRAVAALSLGRLMGGLAKDADGCVDVVQPAADPERPAFVWACGAGWRYAAGGPHGEPWRKVWIAVDRDMAEVRVKARNGRGRIMDFILPAEARARICGRLAVAAWKAAGAREAQAIAPPPGSDFNDELRRRLVVGSAAA